MILEALLASLIISISFFLSEFIKIRSMFEDSIHHSTFFSELGFTKTRFGTGKDKISELEKKFYTLEDRISKQEDVIEKLIKEIVG